jgi:mRNA interferase MazF
MKRGTVVLAPFPFTDLSTGKRRPAIIVSKENPEKTDLIIAFISSIIPETISETDLIIKSTDKEFKQTGLHKASVIKLDKLLTIEKKLLVGEIGVLPVNLLDDLNKKLKMVFDLS